MMEAVRTSETSVDNYFTRQYIPEDNSNINEMVSEIKGEKPGAVSFEDMALKAINHAKTLRKGTGQDTPGPLYYCDLELWILSTTYLFFN
jgi:hypothetical protein